MSSRFLTPLLIRYPWLTRVPRFFLKVGRPALLCTTTLTALVVGLRFLGVYQAIELATYDQFVRLQSSEGADPRLLVVGITESDLQALQEFPLSDRTLATLIEQLSTYEPRAIGVDILRDIPINPGREELLEALHTHDQVITVCKASSTTEPGIAPPEGTSPDQIGFADLVVDSGGILRRGLLLMTPPAYGGTTDILHLCNDPSTILASFSLQLALKYLQVEGIRATFTEDQQLWIGSTHIPSLPTNFGGYQRGDMGGYQILLHYRSEHYAVPQVSLMDVLNDRINPDLIRDRIVLIGYITPDTRDEFYTPYSAGASESHKMPGVIIHAQMVSQLLTAVQEQRSLPWAWGDWVESLWIFGWSLTGGLLAGCLRRPIPFTAMLLIGSGTLYGLCFVIFGYGGWIPVIPALTAFAGTAFAMVVLERFNQSPYGQTVYQRVRTFFHIEINIDQKKLQEQVAEITETDYFHELKSKATRLRKQSNSSPSRLKSQSTPSGRSENRSTDWERSSTPEPKTSVPDEETHG